MTLSIEDAAPETPILVHCVKGESRSVTIVAVYLVARQGQSADEALAWITNRRPCAHTHALVLWSSCTTTPHLVNIQG
jgi:protein-tyrosine phosphatase